MTRTNTLRTSILLNAVLIVALGATATFGQTTSFTYQGRLTDGGTAASGNYDLQFALFDNSSGGAQIGSTLQQNFTAVSGGTFSVQLDFGVNAFPDANRFLEIRVRPSGSGSFTTLSPRQQIGSTPYAIRTLSATTADALSSGCMNCVQDSQINSVAGSKISGAVANASNATNATNATTATNATQLGGVAANQYVQTNDSRLSDARSPIPGSSNYIQNSASPQPGASFNISGNGTIGGALTGTVIDATMQYKLGGAYILSNAGTGNLFTGVGAGQANVNGTNNAFFGFNAGLNNNGNSIPGSPAGNKNSFFGSLAGRDNSTGFDNAYFGYSAGLLSNGYFNAFFGHSAGAGASGNNNAFFGAAAGGSSGNTASNNAFFGYFAGLSNTSGAENAFFGAEAGRSNTEGSSNAFFGGSAGQMNTTASGNSFFGNGAGAANTLGSRNSFFGALAGFSNDGDGTNNRGTDNSFFGFNAGRNNISFYGNSYFGSKAGQSALGSGNTFIGANAGLNTQISDRNTLIGYNAGLNNAGGIGSSGITLVGAGTDVALSSSLSDASAIGARALVRGSHATAIGADARADAPNTVVLGTSSDTVIVPGRLATTLAPSGERTLCYNDSTKQPAYCSSSLRYKTDVRSSNLGLEIINRLRPITFRWKDSRAPDLGLAAEEVAAVEPLLVSHNHSGEIEGVKYDHLNVVLINAVKEQQKQIEQQRTLIKQQAARLARDEQQIEILKKLTCLRYARAAVCK